MWGRLEIALAIAGVVSQSERQPRRVESQLPYLVAELSRQLQQAARFVRGSVVVRHPYRSDGGMASFVVPAVPATLGRDKVVFILNHHDCEGLPCMGIEGRGRHRDMGIGRLDNALGGGERQAGSRLAVTRHPISRLAISTQPPCISTQLGRRLHSSISTFPILPKCLAPAEYPAAVSRTWLCVSRSAPSSTPYVIPKPRQ